MTVQAIQEAADNVRSTQKLIQAKTAHLSEHRFGNDPVSYGRKEIAFDQAADPRIFQLQDMPPDRQKAYIAALPPNVAQELLAKRTKLQKMGIFH